MLHYFVHCERCIGKTVFVNVYKHCFTNASYSDIAPLFHLALGTAPWKIKEVLEIPNLLGFPVPPWNSNTTQKSKEVWEFQGYQLISYFLGIPIPHGNSHTCKNLIKGGIGFQGGFKKSKGIVFYPLSKVK